MIGFIILYVVTVAVFLWFWAMTQSQCNTNSDDIKTGFNLVKNELKVQEGFNKAILDRISKLEEKVAEAERKIPLAPFIPNTPQLIVKRVEPAAEQPVADDPNPELGYTIRVKDDGCTGIRPGKDEPKDVG